MNTLQPVAGADDPDSAPATLPTGGRRVERVQPPSRDPGAPSPVPASAALPLYAFNVTPDRGMRVHRVDRAYGIVFFATCGELTYGLPERVRPTSPWLQPCPRCLPDGVPAN